MKIDSIELRQGLNKLRSEMGFISKDAVKKIIKELEEKALTEEKQYVIISI